MLKRLAEEAQRENQMEAAKNISSVMREHGNRVSIEVQTEKIDISAGA